MSVRIDKFLWSVRLYKTRADATEACKSNRVQIGGVAVKPSREVKVGDHISIRKMPVVYTYRVVELVANRQPAKNVRLYISDITPAEELLKLEMASIGAFAVRDRGMGRPTKRDRREIDGLIEDGFEQDLDDDDDDDEE